MSRNFSSKIVFIVLLLLMAFSGIYLYLDKSYQKDIDRVLEQQTSGINHHIRLAEQEFRNLSGVVYEEAINTEEIKSIFQAADVSEGVNLSMLRGKFQQLLGKTYKNLQGLGFAQMVFYSDNGELLYGFGIADLDSKKMRGGHSVEKVLESGITLKGFGVDASHVGYSYIYPMLQNDAVIGAVKFTVSMDGITKLIRQNGHTAVTAFFDKEIVDKNMLQERSRDIFLDTSLLSGYYKSVVGDRGGIEDIDEMFSESFGSVDAESLSFYTDGGYSVTAIDVFDMRNEQLGYLFVYQKDAVIQELYDDFKEELLLFFALCAAVGGFFIKQFAHDYKIWLSEHRFKNLFQQNRSAMLLFQHKGNELYIKDINKAACELFGVKESDYAGRAAELLFKVNGEALKSDILQLKTKIVYQLPDAEGNGKSIEIYPTEIESGGFLEIICIVFDETERLYYQNMLAESEQRYKELSSFAEEGILLSKEDGIIDMNPACRNILGYEPVEVLGQSFLDFLAQDEAESIRKVFDRREDSFYTVALKKDGERVPLFVKYKTVEKDGKPLRVIVIRDLREIRALEDELKKQQDFVSSIIENTPVVLFYKDIEGFYRICNRYFLEAFGLKSYDEVIGKKAQDVMPKSIVSEMLEIDDGIFSGQYEKKSFESILELDGKMHYLFINKVAFVDSSGKVQGVIGTAMDITELKEMEQNLRVFNEQLSEQVEHEVAERMRLKRESDAKEKLLIQQSKMAEIGNMVAAIAHQWKQPLNVVSILTQNLIDKYEFDEVDIKAMEKFGEDIGKQVRFMSQTMDDFRNFFKPSKEKKSFLLKSAVADVQNLLGVQFEKLNITVTIGGSDTVSVYGYPNELKQVMLNLMNNAKDAIVQHKIKNGMIAIEVEQNNEFGILKVQDNAGGVPGELLPDKLFEQYVSTKGEDGTGIGLSMSKTIVVDSMGGKIEASNTEDGALFVLAIPLAEVPL